MTQRLALGGEVFCLKPPQQPRYISGLGFGARYQADGWVAAAQVTSTKLFSAMYARRLYNDKLTLASGEDSLGELGIGKAAAMAHPPL